MARKPLPTETKRRNGNPGKRSLNTGEPQPKNILPEPPEHLGDVGQARWRELAAELYGLGILTVVDVDALLVYCDAYETYINAKKKIEDPDEGAVVFTDKGNPIQNPWLSIKNQALERMIKVMSEFGMTPSSRSRVGVAKGASKDKLEKFRASKKET